jgi:hypothetical protein
VTAKLTHTLIPVGKNRGKPIANMQTKFLLWWLSQDGLRRAHQPVARAIVAELRKRLNDDPQLARELFGERPASRPVSAVSAPDFKSDLV